MNKDYIIYKDKNGNFLKMYNMQLICHKMTDKTLDGEIKYSFPIKIECLSEPEYPYIEEI